MKILAVLLCAFTVFALAACGEKDENKDKKSKADTSTVSDTESGDGESQTGDGIILPEGKYFYVKPSEEKNRFYVFSKAGENLDDTQKRDTETIKKLLTREYLNSWIL